MSNPLESLSTLKKVAARENWFKDLKIVFQGFGPQSALMFTYFAPLAACITEYYGEEVESVMEKEMGIKVFSYEKDRRVRHLDTALFQNYYYLDHGDEIAKYLSSLSGNVVFIPFQTNKAVLDFLFKHPHQWKLFQNPVIVQNYFDHKPRLTWRAPDIGIPMPPDAGMRLFGDVTYGRLVDEYGKDYVIQVPLSAAGGGTFFVHSEDDYNGIIESQKKAIGSFFSRTQIKITPYMNGPSLNCTGCVVNGEVALSPPDIQIVGDPSMVSLPGQYIGSDFALNAFGSSLRQEMMDIVHRVGMWLGRNAYRGTFGVDFLTQVDSQGKIKALYVSEVNARFVGEIQYMSDWEAMKDVLPLPFFHLAEYLELDIKPEHIREYNKNLPDLQGSALLIYKREQGTFRSPGKLKSGVYKFVNDKLTRLRDGINLSDAKADDEFVISNGVPCEDFVIGHPRHGDGEVFLLYIYTKESIVDPKNWKVLSEKWRGIANRIRDEIGLEKCEYRSLKEKS